jgi:hypothetical protein
MGMVMIDDDADLPDSLKKPPEESLKEAEEIIKRWHRPDRGLFYAISPRSGWSCSPAFLENIKQLREKYKVCYIQTHLGECKWVLKKVREKWGENSDSSYFYKRGILSDRTVVAHGVYCNEAEKKILKDNHVGISHNPTSDDVTLKNEDSHFELNVVNEEILVGLGVDEPWNLPIFNVMRKAKEIQERHGKFFPASLYFYLYTLGGAKTLGLESICGNFGKGKKGDFVILQTNRIVNKKGSRILNNIEELLEAVIELGGRSLIREVYIGGKRSGEPSVVPKVELQRIPAEGTELELVCRERMLEQFEKPRERFRKDVIHKILMSLLKRLLRGEGENFRFASVIGEFQKISWVAGVFYSEELPPNERFVNVFALSPLRTHSLTKKKSFRTLQQLAIEFLYRKWEQEEKILPMFSVFLQSPKKPLEFHKDLWISKTAVFIRDKEAIIPGRQHVDSPPQIDIANLVPEDTLATVRRKMLFINKSVKDNKVAKENKIEELVEYNINALINTKDVLERMQNILEKLAIALKKPNLLDAQTDNANRLFRTLYLLMLQDDEWQYYYYFPAQVIPWEAVGAFAIGSKESLPDDFIKVWRNLTSTVFTPLTLLDRERKIFRRASKSAIAAIMARNMAHQQGSSVIPWMIKREKQSKRALIHYFSYIQRRMDFVATVATMAFPKWGVTVSFFKDLIVEFVTQFGLIDSLCKNDGYDYNNIRLVVYIGQNNENLLAVKPDTSPPEPTFSVEEINTRDTLLKIPGGLSGMHAFFLILENIMRNAVKYGDRNGNKKLMLKIVLEENPDNSSFYKVSVWDNLSNRIDKIDEINQGIKEALITETSETRPLNWGLAEMRLAAAYLINSSLEKAAYQISNEEKCIIEAFSSPDNTIGYTFYLQKPTLIEVHHE